MKQEKLDWLADHPFTTKRFAFFVGRRCRTTTIKDVAGREWGQVFTFDITRMTTSPMASVAYGTALGSMGAT